MNTQQDSEILPLLASLISSTLPYARHHCRRLGIPISEAEDIVQDVALSFHLQRTRILHPRSWFSSAIRTRCLMVHRTRSRRPTSPLTDRDLTHPHLLDPGHRSQVESRLDAVRLLRKVDPRWRRMFVLLSVGYGRAEAAREVGISEGSVGKVLQRCRAKMARGRR